MDAGAGIQENVLSLHHPSFESLVVLTPDPTSLTDGYSLIKLLRNQAGVRRFSVAVNQVTDGRHGLSVFQKLKEVAGWFTDAELEYMGHCPRDEKIMMSVLKRKILLDLDEGAPSVACLELIAKRISRQMQADFSARSDKRVRQSFMGEPVFADGTNPESVSGRTGARGAREHGEVLENFVRRGETMRLNPGIQKYRESAKRKARHPPRNQRSPLRRPRAPERALSKSSLNPWKKPPPPRPPRKRKPRSSRRSPPSSRGKRARRTSSSKTISLRQRTRERLVLEYAPLIKYIAQKIAARLPANIELDDLISSGVIGLMDAIEKYDSKRDNKFKTYAEFRIRGAILDELRAQDWVPRSVREKAKILERCLRQDRAELGPPGHRRGSLRGAQASRRTSSTTCSIRSAAFRLLSYDDLSTFSKADRALFTASRESGAKAPTPFNEVNVAYVKRMIAEAINDLPEKQRLVLIAVLLRGSEPQGNRPSPGRDRVAREPAAYASDSASQSQAARSLG